MGTQKWKEGKLWLGCIVMKEESILNEKFKNIVQFVSIPGPQTLTLGAICVWFQISSSYFITKDIYQ